MSARPKAEKGAPAALKAIEEHEVRCREEKDIARDLWKAALTSRVEGDDVSERVESRTHRDYLDALEIWDDATKKLALYDKQIAPEKREGEKISKADADRWITGWTRHTRLALEQTILSVAQDAMRCSSEQDFYDMAADRFRGTLLEAMRSALAEEQLPQWISDATARGL